MATEEKEKPKEGAARSRLIVRLGAFLVSHNLFVSVVCCITGLIALLLLPVLAKNTYISENALMPG
ncbi:putative glycosylphosphatidylinositol anchor attachment 1 protein [Cocos nucifera]|uniref:Putative glycosylphosphatidylinositol anchor attachment 1 protein n=1 Tax=Cocos nucifera TaxID=13894 RepID=A0A8K0HW13_COCNU|nr:putative glycosylphosphatidylinositol anchor attachment 1 protein [Cocos nucifera]